MSIQSPLTQQKAVLQERFSTQLIIEAYHKQHAIDTSAYFKDLDWVDLFRCCQSGYRFYYPFHLAGKADLYTALQTKYTWYYTLRWEHEMASTFIQPAQSILEVGCGIGLFLECLYDKSPTSLAGLEFNQEAVRIGQSKGLGLFNQDIRGHANELPGYYDVVCSFQVLEHICEVGNFITACVDSLKVGGKLILGVPNNNPYLFKYDRYCPLNLPPHHMGLWNKQALASLPRFFPLRMDEILVEPLFEYDYDRYFNVQSAHWNSRHPILGSIVDFLLFKFRPTRLRQQLKQKIGASVEGRNLLAVYTKL
ncbi:MAG: class I SAM-dependent methyltransferase [Leptolyngbyaceae cyanobacterium bins.59]|nr:class I SAM-dependent methyltransferase [Leptolyngbyaceae cyanobacterium bins.59]